jgi:hypothetical protein
MESRGSPGLIKPVMDPHTGSTTTSTPAPQTNAFRQWWCWLRRTVSCPLRPPQDLRKVAWVKVFSTKAVFHSWKVPTQQLPQRFIIGIHSQYTNIENKSRGSKSQSSRNRQPPHPKQRPSSWVFRPRPTWATTTPLPQPPATTAR